MAIVKQKEFTHFEMCQKAVRWLYGNQGCAFALMEITSANGEVPDAIGWNGSMSTVIEVKRSRADFFADKLKPHRIEPHKGMGSRRWFLTPKDLVKPEELPENWGLIYLRGDTQTQIVKEAGGFHEYDQRSEMAILVGAARRVTSGCPYISRQLGLLTDAQMRAPLTNTTLA